MHSKFTVVKELPETLHNVFEQSTNFNLFSYFESPQEKNPHFLHPDVERPIIWELRFLNSFSCIFAVEALFFFLCPSSICRSHPVFPLTPPSPPVNHSWSPRTATAPSFYEDRPRITDMVCGAQRLLVLIPAFWGLVSGGPMTNLHPNITDQQLFWGADQYDFSVVLPAAGLECFWHFAHRGETFYLNFMVRTRTLLVLTIGVSMSLCSTFEMA